MCEKNFRKISKQKRRPRKLFTVLPYNKTTSDPVSDKRANTAKNVRNIESKLQTKHPTKFSKKNSEKKISQNKLLAQGIIHSITLKENFPRPCVGYRANTAKNAQQNVESSCKKTTRKKNFEKKKFQKKMVTTGIIHSITFK